VVTVEGSTCSKEELTFILVNEIRRTKKFGLSR
jgi:hypothetical protein